MCARALAQACVCACAYVLRPFLWYLSGCMLPFIVLHVCVMHPILKLYFLLNALSCDRTHFPKIQSFFYGFMRVRIFRLQVLLTLVLPVLNHFPNFSTSIFAIFPPAWIRSPEACRFHFLLWLTHCSMHAFTKLQVLSFYKFLHLPRKSTRQHSCNFWRFCILTISPEFLGGKSTCLHSCNFLRVSCEFPTNCTFLRLYNFRVCLCSHSKNCTCLSFVPVCIQSQSVKNWRSSTVSWSKIKCALEPLFLCVPSHRTIGDHISSLTWSRGLDTKFIFTMFLLHVFMRVWPCRCLLSQPVHLRSDQPCEMATWARR